jgi:hypothetical protein
MPEVASAQRQTGTRTARETAPNRVAELRVSAHLMTLDTGLFCIVVGGQPSALHNGLPGVRLSPPPGPTGRPQSVSISTFRNDGWLSGGEAGLVRITDGPAQILVTIYQAPDATPEQAPRLTVLPLIGEGAAARVPAGQNLGATAPSTTPEVVAHIQRMGDVPGHIGEWIGTRGSRLWIEGFGLAPRDGISPAEIEYQAVLGKDWLSPWVEGGKFCGSRGMALPVLGLNVRLKGAAATTHELSYSASFVDGTTIGPLAAGEPCQAESLAALEAFQVVIRPKDGAHAPEPPPGDKAEVANKRAAPVSTAKKPARRRD